jgi:hypothetical protein
MGIPVAMLPLVLIVAASAAQVTANDGSRPQGRWLRH